MVYEKFYMGEQVQDTLKVHYYVIQKERYYGIALEEVQGDKTKCDYEFFTEDRDQALRVGKMMQKGFVTLTSMTEILDDFIQ